MKRSEMTCAKCIYWDGGRCREKGPVPDTVNGLPSARFPEDILPMGWCGRGLFEDDDGQLWAFHEGTTEKSEKYDGPSLKRFIKIRLPNVGEDD